MRVVLEVQDGPDRGRKAVLRARQALRVGRTERSDFVLAGDQQLSSRHFMVECDDRACQIRDLESTNGTLLNGEPVGQARLRHGDEIYAGQTLLRVTIEALVADDFPEESPIKSVLGAGVLRMPIVCQRRECASGLTLLESDRPEPAPHVVAHRLSNLASGYVLIDPRRAELEPAALATSTALIDELPAEVSPRLAPLAESLPLVEQAWGRDGMAIVFSLLAPEEVTQHLRQALRFDPGVGRGSTTALLALHWPSVGRILLEHCPPAMTSQLFGSALEGLMVEGLPPVSWQLFCGGTLAKQALGAGFEIPATD